MIGEDLQKFSGSRVMRTIAIGRLPIRNPPKGPFPQMQDRHRIYSLTIGVKVFEHFYPMTFDLNIPSVSFCHFMRCNEVRTQSEMEASDQLTYV
ncbi:hypothetical protein AVEN_189017-1 [Araneus ventricosus]|uniref:Uncharacterized protein n=1 Tax=Araneus ventricosus TaxID=182803 RepID=A0A4Y2R560_ARAVE|nr:hypothetical protein AVEN_189017-1 [Araneus ventricosus]